MIQEWTPKPTPARVCGPWNGSDESAAEFAELAGPDQNGEPGFRPALIGTAAGQGAARVWNRYGQTWVTVRRGEYVVAGRDCHYLVLSERELREFYQPAETGGETE